MPGVAASHAPIEFLDASISARMPGEEHKDADLGARLAGPDGDALHEAVLRAFVA
jgi:hypothetical protein